ncbi:protease Do-like 5, chloroplastic isoform X2 [Nicotiana tomentosiformis]|uniref:protease Do-like 5, chloroplastic isoform X2 n=1 Tax=Nicotiana tomentosiformis TaxID=4098 RepID=UPI00388CE93E
MQQLKGQVTDYHVIAKLATDQSGLQHCKVSLVNAKGESIAKGAKIVGVDPAYDMAFLKIDVEGDEIKPSLCWYLPWLTWNSGGSSGRVIGLSKATSPAAAPVCPQGLTFPYQLTQLYGP